MRSIVDRVLRSEFLKNVSTQMIGTGLAQALPFLATPALTRLYSQDDFARYTSFFAVASVFAVAAGGRYNLAIVLPKLRQDAILLHNLSVYITLYYALFLALLFQGMYWLGLSQSIDLVYFVPLYVLFYGVWSSLINVSVRDKTFLINAYSKVYQAAGYIITAILFGLTKLSSYGLVMAKTFGALGSGAYLLWKMGDISFKPSWREYKAIALEYVDYPKYSLAPALLNTLTAQAFILFLAQFYDKMSLGYYGLTFMVLSAPLGLIGISYRDVFYQRITELINQGRYAQGLSFFRKSAWLLFICGMVIALTLLFFGPPLFGFVFGNDWIRSGEFAAILSLSFMVKLVASPLSSVFNACNKIKVASVWQVLYFVTTFITLGVGAYLMRLDIIKLLYLYLIHEVLLYALYFVLQYRTISRLGYTND